MKGIELKNIKTQYKFTLNQGKKINQAKNWMLTKYKNVRIDESITIIKGKLQTIITLTAKDIYE